MPITAPTLIYDVTTVTLPHPVNVPEDAGIAQIVNVSILGYSRVQKMYSAPRWSFEFIAETYTMWASIRTLWAAATTALAFPTLTYTDVFTDANATEVVVELGPYTPLGGNVSVGDFTLTLTQVNPS